MSHSSIYDFEALSIDGQPAHLSTQKGKVLLIVNTASACGFTPQFGGLEQLWKDYRDRGLVIVGFPSNEFGAQDPGSNEDIASFCQLNYGVSFPMMSKVQVTRPGDTKFLPGDTVDRLELRKLNEGLLAEGKQPAKFSEVLLGVTKASLSTDSFLSASSFQHTIKVLAGAAIGSTTDPLIGLKENVIIGKLIPAGTGFIRAPLAKEVEAGTRDRDGASQWTEQPDASAAD